MAKDSILVTVSMHSALHDAIQDCKHTFFLQTNWVAFYLCFGNTSLTIMILLCCTHLVLVDHDSGLLDVVLPLTSLCKGGGIIIVSFSKVFEVLVPPSSLDIFVCGIF